MQRRAVQSFTESRHITMRPKALVLLAALRDRRPDHVLLRAILVWQMKSKANLLLKGMIKELIRWRNSFCFVQHFVAKDETVASRVARWRDRAGAAKDALAESRLIRAEASAKASEAELEISALTAELFLCTTQAKLQTANARHPRPRTHRTYDLS